jgi:putative transposase
MPPCEIVPTLADEGTYIASESTFYRILREEKMQNHRGRYQKPRKYAKPTSYCATASNQVWTWDITYLNGPVKGLFYYLYLIVDLFSRDIVGWEVWEEESAFHASELIRRACLAQGRLTTQPLVLHSDNGSPMKGATMLETLYALGITPSNSRPRVSNDNPYSESIFKTLKYRPNYQPKGFENIDKARRWCKRFVQWYRYEHHHSGIKFLKPAERHSGKSAEILANRTEVYQAARLAHPERWNGRATRDWNDINEVYLNPDKTYEETEKLSLMQSEKVS